MRFSCLYLTSVLGALATSSPLAARADAPPGIAWSPCGFATKDPFNHTVGLLCGNMSVPLDYTNKDSDKTINLPVVKVPAAAQPSKGSIFIDAGGPGINNTFFLQQWGGRLQIMTGGEHDIVSFRPRGTNGDLLFSCYSNNTMRAAASASLPSLGRQIAADSSDNAMGQIWGESQIFDTACYEANNQTGDLVGTAFTVRDMMQLVDALEPDGLLRYWGFSYGTLLGSTAVAMFPDKVDKVILDGVVNPLEYYNSPVYQGDPAQADSALSGLIKACIANTTLCPVGANTTAEKMEAAFYKELEDLKANPLPLPGLFTLITYSSVTSVLFDKLYSPATWAASIPLFTAILTRNATLLTEALSAPPPPGPVAPAEVDAESTKGIKCGDNAKRYSSYADLLPEIDAFHNSSRIGGNIYDVQGAQCAQWPFVAKERYTGSFCVKPAKPVLLIANIYDPITPVAAARNVTEGFEGSSLLLQDGYGHTSSAQASLCTVKAVKAYFKDGTLPQNGTICKIDEPLLYTEPQKTYWNPVLIELSNS